MEEFAMQICCEVVEKYCEEGVAEREAFDFMGRELGCFSGFSGPELNEKTKHNNPLFSRRIEDSLH
jgi:hypothetical protein